MIYSIIQFDKNMNNNDRTTALKPFEEAEIPLFSNKPIN
jgi:hypothetical protein